jgi:carboxylate-amine ligase
MGYRLSAYAELPRTGLPELFLDPADYRTYVETLTAAGAIKDASYIWWAIRPSDKHPTLELRIADSCTRLDDTLAIAALYRCLIRHLQRNPGLNTDLTAASRAIAAENIWRAQRYGSHGGLICAESRTMRTVPSLVDDLVEQLAGDAAALGCTRDLAALPRDRDRRQQRRHAARRLRGGASSGRRTGGRACGGRRLAGSETRLDGAGLVAQDARQHWRGAA